MLPGRTSVSETSIRLGPDRDGLWVIATGDRISYCGPEPPLEPASQARAEIPCPLSTLEPGKINAHTHVYSGLAPFGMPPPADKPQNFIQILERVWWRLDRALDEASLRAAARLYVAEALLAGTTTLIDHHESPYFIGGSLDVLADVCDELGIRAILCFGATERNGGRDEARRGLLECRRFIEANTRPLVQGVVSLHASFTVSDETIRQAARMCRELDSVVHVHLAEDPADIQDANDRGYPGPLERLLAWDAAPRGSILAHGVHCRDHQVRLAADNGLWFVQNPRSNRGNNVGYPLALGESPLVALGTDGYPARMAEEADALLEEAAAHGEPLEKARVRLDGAYRLAAERFGSRFAPLGRGSAADVVAFEGRRARQVVVGGRLVVEDGELLTANLGEIRSEAERQAARLWTRMGAIE